LGHFHPTHLVALLAAVLFDGCSWLLTDSAAFLLGQNYGIKIFTSLS
jgi:hypothetical protein